MNFMDWSIDQSVLPCLFVYAWWKVASFQAWDGMVVVRSNAHHPPLLPPLPQLLEAAIAFSTTPKVNKQYGNWNPMIHAVNEQRFAPAHARTFFFFFSSYLSVLVPMDAYQLLFGWTSPCTGTLYLLQLWSTRLQVHPHPAFLDPPP